MIHTRIAFRKHTTSAVKSAPKSLTKTSETSMKSVPVRKDPSFTPISFSTARKQDFEIQSETWTPAEKRTGVLAVKKGMLSMWDKWGQHLPATVLQLEDTYVLGQRKQEPDVYRDGDDAEVRHYLMVGCKQKAIETAEEAEKFRFQIGWCQKAGIGFCLERVVEFPVTEKGLLPVGLSLNAAHFTAGQFVDVQAISKDKGFQGVVKRWGFKGQSASHGTSLAHRSPGSIGQRKDPGKVFKGKKMPGQMGKESVTVHSLRIIKIDKSLNLIYVKGTVPGPRESIVSIRDALFKHETQWDAYSQIAPCPPFPTISTESLRNMPNEIMWEPKAEDGKPSEDPLVKKYNLDAK